MNRKIVLGSLFGDEGKGVCVNYLCKKALNNGLRPLVVRFTGGPQAAHTVDEGGIRHVFSSFGSGTLLGVPTLYRNTALIDPVCIVNELNVLKNKGINPVYDFSAGIIITPYDVDFNRNDKKTLSDGTCGKGVWASLVRSRSGKCFTLSDNPETILAECASYYGVERCKEFDEMFTEAFNFVRQTQTIINKNDYDTIIYEGTQGLLLDAELGFLPNVTATNTGLQYLTNNELNGTEVYLATRTYLTRHGNGYTPQQVDGYDLADKSESNVFNGYQGNFKTGVFDFDLLNEAFKRHSIDKFSSVVFKIFLTHMDTVERNGKFVYLDRGQLYETSPNRDTVAKIYEQKTGFSVIKFPVGANYVVENN